MDHDVADGNVHRDGPRARQGGGLDPERRSALARCRIPSFPADFVERPQIILDVHDGLDRSGLARGGEGRELVRHRCGVDHDRRRGDRRSYGRGRPGGAILQGADLFVAGRGLCRGLGDGARRAERRRTGRRRRTGERETEAGDGRRAHDGG